MGFCPQAVAHLGFLGGRLGVSSVWQGAASDTFLFLFPLGLLPQCMFPNASVLGQRAVAVLLVSGNSEAILRAVSDECICLSLHLQHEFYCLDLFLLA